MSQLPATRAAGEVEWFATPGRVAIAIGGCARSGTTLLSTMLSAHSQIHLYSSDGFDRESGVLLADEDLIGRGVSRILASDPPSPGETHWCEKTPGNVNHASKILRYFGAAGRFLHIVRDGRDVVCSIHPSRPDTYWVRPQRWVRDVAAGRACEGTAGFKTIRYEDLVADPRSTLVDICDFVGLAFEESLLRYPESASVRKSGAWFGDDAQPLHDASIGRWRADRHRDAVDALLEHPSASELLAAYGYS
jgi:hypothetical protein